MAHYLVLISIILFCPDISFAETPKEFVTRIFQEVKESGNVDRFIENVHWEESYKSMSPSLKPILGIQSPKDLKQYTIDTEKNPEKIIRRISQAQFQDLGEDDQQLIDMMMPAFREQAKEILTKNKIFIYNLAKYDYKIGTAEIDKNKAKIPVQFKDANKNTQDLILTLIASDKNSWLFVLP